MRTTLPILIVLLVVSLPSATAQDSVDATIRLHDTAPPMCDCPLGWFNNTEWTPGEAAEWQLGLPRDYTVVDLEMPPGYFSTERVRQVVPLLDEAHRDYPLFNYFPRPDVWTAESPVRLFHHIETDDLVTLRLGIPGPNTGTLRLERDVSPPEYELGPVHRISHLGFHQNTTTNELAIGDLQRRPAGSTAEWVSTPTPTYHVQQIFPIQGLDPDTAYDVRARFTDWAGNNVTSDTYTVRTLARVVGEDVVVTPVSPADGSIVPEGAVRIEARMSAADAAIDPNRVRLFLDLTPIAEGFAFNGETLVHVTHLDPGPHVVAVEATSFAGGTGYTRWTFEVEGAEADTGTTPAPGLATLLIVMAGLVVLSRRLRA